MHACFQKKPLHNNIFSGVHTEVRVISIEEGGSIHPPLLHTTSSLAEPDLTCRWSLGPWWYSGSWKSHSLQLNINSHCIDLHYMTHDLCAPEASLQLYQLSSGLDRFKVWCQYFSFILYMKWKYCIIRFLFKFFVVHFWTDKSTSAHVQCVHSFPPPYIRAPNSDFSACMCLSLVQEFPDCVYSF